MTSRNLGNPDLSNRKFDWGMWAKWFLYVITFLLWLKGGISTDGDAITYINMDPHRSAGYPLFIKLTSLFGLVHSYRLTALIALAFGLFVIFRFVDFLKGQFKLSSISVFVTSFIFMLPYLVSRLANSILTETLAYPLFLLAVHMLLKSAFEKSKRSAIIYLIVVSLLVLVRSQFIFFNIISLLIILYLTWYSQNKIKYALPLLGVFLITILSGNLVDRTYHLALHKHFAVAPFIGVQLETMPLYNLKDNDLNLFTDTLKRGLIDTVLSCEKASDIYNIGKNKVKSSEYESFKFMHSYNPISWQFAEKYIEHASHKKGLDRKSMDFWIYLDHVTTQIAFRLIKAHPKEYAWIYLVNFKSGFGDWQLLLPFIMLFLFSIISFFKTGNKISILFLTVCVLMLSNITLICIFEPSLDRYTFYTTYLMLAIIFIPVFKSLEKVSENETQKGQIDIGGQ
jgi:hypothetical protein